MLQPVSNPGTFPVPPNQQGYNPHQPTAAQPYFVPPAHEGFAPPAMPGDAQQLSPAVPQPMNALYPAPTAPPPPATIPEEADETQYDEIWVAKAKEIVAQTQDDPYRQSRAISKLRADFLKARYNKDIKIVEDSAA